MEGMEIIQGVQMIINDTLTIKCNICHNDFNCLEESKYHILGLCEGCINESKIKSHLERIASHNIKPLKYVDGRPVLNELDIDKIYDDSCFDRCILCGKESKDCVAFNNIANSTTMRILVCSHCLNSNSAHITVITEKKVVAKQLTLSDHNNKMSDSYYNMVYGNEVDVD